MTGERFGRLVVLGLAEHPRRWRVKCDCGAKKIVYGHNLRAGRTRSCGCLQREWARTGGARNLRQFTGRRVAWNGEVRTTGEWARLTGIPGGRITKRLRAGWPVEAALTTRVGCPREVA